MDGKNTESRGTTKGADRKTATRLQGDWGDNTTGNDHRLGDGLSIFLCLIVNCIFLVLFLMYKDVVT